MPAAPTRDSGLKNDVFISYAKANRGVARRVQAFLQRFQTDAGRRLSVYLDETHIRGGDLTVELTTALSSSAALVVICSNAAAASTWVQREIEAFQRRDRPRIALVLAADEPASAIPALLRSNEIRFHDIRQGAIAGIWRNAARLELVRLVAWLTGADLSTLVNWERRRLLKVSAAAVGALVLPTGAAYWYADRNRPVEAPEIAIDVVLSWIDEDGVGKGLKIDEAMLASITLNLDVLPKSLAGASRQWKWPTNAQRFTGMPDTAVRLDGRLEGHELASAPSTAGIWYESKRRFRFDAKTLGLLSNFDEWDGAVAAVTYSSLGLGVEHPVIDGVDVDEHRRELTKQAEAFYSIDRREWENMDYSITGVPVSAELTLTVRNRVAGKAKAKALHVWEHDEDVRDLQALIFKPFHIQP
jgi:hypothetical protein